MQDSDCRFVDSQVPGTLTIQCTAERGVDNKLLSTWSSSVDALRRVRVKYNPAASRPFARKAQRLTAGNHPFRHHGPASSSQQQTASARYMLRIPIPFQAVDSNRWPASSPFPGALARPIQSTRKGREEQEPEVVTHLSGAFIVTEANM